MKLLVDIGNSRIKWACQEDGQLRAPGAFAWSVREPDRLFDEQWSGLKALESVWVANVAGAQVAERLERWFEARGITPRHARSLPRACGVENSYHEAAQLGVDRFVAMIGAWRRYRRALCVVDCGTAVTVDGLSAEGVFLGGVIAPGAGLMQRTLASHTHALGVSASQAMDVCARSTQDGIAAGCLHAVAGFVERVFAELRARLGADLLCVLTGGEAARLRPALSIACEHDPHLVLHGLSVWAEEMA